MLLNSQYTKEENKQKTNSTLRLPEIAKQSNKIQNDEKTVKGENSIAMQGYQEIRKITQKSTKFIPEETREIKTHKQISKGKSISKI